MKFNWEFLALIISRCVSLLTICGYLWKITKFLGAKSKSVDTRIHALYDVLRVQSARLSDIAEYLTLPQDTRGTLYKRNSLEKLENSAFKDYEDEQTPFD